MICALSKLNESGLFQTKVVSRINIYVLRLFYALFFYYMGGNMKVSKIKGTLDYFGRDVKKYRYIENVARSISKQFGYLEIVTPIFEATEVFARGVGEGTDIVNKEMYTFLDRSEKSLTLRPEGTAGVSRAYVENKMYVDPGLKKLFYFGQMFRCERPQAGRYRAFTQFGIEALGPGSAYLDADVIYFGYLFLQKLGIKNVKVAINTIGSKSGRAKYEEALKEYFSAHIDEMCNDCKTRLEKNPLRILDCKVDAKSDIMKNAPKIIDYLSEEDIASAYQVIKMGKAHRLMKQDILGVVINKYTGNEFADIFLSNKLETEVLAKIPYIPHYDNQYVFKESTEAYECYNDLAILLNAQD